MSSRTFHIDNRYACVFRKTSQNNLRQAFDYYWAEQNKQISPILTCYILKRIVRENQIIINNIIDNLGFEKYLLYHMKRTPIFISYKEERNVFNEIMNNPKIIKFVFQILEWNSTFRWYSP